MSWTRNPGRVVGFWYLLLVLGGPLRLIYIPNKLFVHDNAAATASNIAAHEWLFRFGMLSDLLGAVVLIFLVLAFYRLFKGVDQQLAVLLVIVGGVMPALINFVNVVSDAGALMVARGGGGGGGVGGADFLSVFDKPQRDALVMLFLRLHHHQIVAAEILWGLWLFPMGALAYKSRFLPRFIGVWLIINGVAYIVLSLHRPEPHGALLSGLSGQGVCLFSARPVRGAGDHVVARIQGRQSRPTTPLGYGVVDRSANLLQVKRPHGSVGRHQHILAAAYHVRLRSVLDRTDMGVPERHGRLPPP